MTDKEKKELQDSIHFTGKNTFRIDGIGDSNFDKQFDKAIQKILVKKYAKGEILNAEISPEEYMSLKLGVIIKALKKDGHSDEEIADMMIESCKIADQMAKEHMEYIKQFSVVGGSDREDSQ